MSEGSRPTRERLEEIRKFSLHGGDWPGGSLAALQEVIALLDSHEQTIHEIRKRLWLGHGHVGLYGDDGEMQCSLGGCMLDFKRDPLDKIIDRLNEQRERTTQQLCVESRTGTRNPIAFGNVQLAPADLCRELDTERAAHSQTQRDLAALDGNLKIAIENLNQTIQAAEKLARALEIAINTVECASIDRKPGSVTQGEELPWYKAARAALAQYAALRSGK